MTKNKKHSIIHISLSSLGVFISRFFGLFRTAVNTHFFNIFQLDIYFTSFRLPNTFRSIMAEGALQNSFVPVYMEVKGTEKEQEFLDSFFTLFIVTLFFLTLILILFIPLFMPLLVPGFKSFSNEKIHETIKLSQYIFPYLFLISLTSFFSSILNSFYKFFASNLNQAFFNITFILIVIVSAIFNKISLNTFIYAVLISGLAQMFSLIPHLNKLGISFKLSFKFNNPYLKQTLKLFLPSLFSSSAYQINIFISVFFLSLFPGAIAYSYIAQRIYQLPVGIFSVAMGQVFLTTFSDNLKNNDIEKLNYNFNYSLKISFFIAIPVIGYFISAGLPVLKLIFFHGKYELKDIIYSYKFLLIYLPGLLFISNNRILTSFYYSQKSFKQPVFSTLISLLTFYLTVLLSYKKIGMYSVALGTLISLITQFSFLLILASKMIKIKNQNILFYIKVILSTIIAFVPVFYISNIYKWINPIKINLSSLNHILFTIGISFLYILIFFIISNLLKIEESKLLLEKLLKRKKL